MPIDLQFDWKAYSWIKRGNRRKKALLFLLKASEPVTATILKKAQKVDITWAAFTLSALWKKGLVDCLNPEDHHGKLFVINKAGKKVLKKVEQSL